MPIMAPSAPPRKTRAQGGGNSSTIAKQVVVPLSAKGQERAQGLKDWASLATLACIMRGLHADAGAIGIHGDAAATELARLGDSQEKIGKWLDYIMLSGPYAALFGAMMPLAVQVLVNHKVIPVPIGMDGIFPPEALEAQVRADLAVAQAEAMLAQQQAEQQLADVKAQMNGLNPENREGKANVPE